MSSPRKPFPISSIDPAVTALKLQAELKEFGVTSDMNDGYRLAVVSVYRGLIVWTNGIHYWWYVTQPNGQYMRCWHLTSDPYNAAKRIVRRYNDLRRRHSAPKEEEERCTISSPL